MEFFYSALGLRALGWELERGSWCRDLPSPPKDLAVRQEFFDPYSDWRVPLCPHFFILLKKKSGILGLRWTGCGLLLLNL
jgi:hypothetical protein